MDRPIGLGELAVMYGMALCIPVLLWMVENPELAAGVGALAVGVYATARVGAWVVRRSIPGETGDAGEAGGTSGRAAD